MRTVLLIAFVASSASVRADEPGTVARFRRPVAIECLGDELVVGNRRSGTLSFVDVASREVRSEIEVAERVSELAVYDGGRELLVTDEERHELVRLSRGGGNEWTVVGRIPVARYPVNVVVVNGRAVVASSWSRRLTIVDLAEGSTERTVLDLPFVPGRQLALPDGSVVVASAFDGRLIRVTLDPPRVASSLELAGHNVGGLAFDADQQRLLVTQAVLRDDTGTTYENVFWGGVLKNVMQTVSIDEVRSGKPATPPDVTFLGFPSNAAGDPAGIVVTSTGATVVAIAGVDTVQLRTGPTAPFETLEAGRRPSAIAVTPDGTTAFVANTYGDSLTVLDLENAEQAGTISLGPNPEPTLVDRGEDLFHDARISLDGWYSCHTCHTNGHTSNQRTDNLGDGDFGDPKRIPSLLGTHGTEPWAWNGSSPSLAHQIEKSILKTMRGEVAEPDDVAALVAYLDSLPAAPSLAAAREESTREDRALATRGERLFRDRGCVECHAGERLTTPDLYDVGLRDRSGHTEFNPPSLRGVSQRSGFLHDGRAPTLRSVLGEFHHPAGEPLPARDVDALLAYLRTL